MKSALGAGGGGEAKDPYKEPKWSRDVHRRGPPPPPRNFDPDRRREILIQTAVFGVLAVRETTDQ